MTIELPQELESRLRERAAQQGLDAATFVRATLEEKLESGALANGGRRRPLYEMGTTEELNRALDEIANRNIGLPVLPPEALESESLYDESV